MEGIDLIPRTYRVRDICMFYRIRDQWGAFSNFSRHQVEIDGTVATSSESVYQAYKFPGNPELQRAILAASPLKAKELAWANQGQVRKDWRDDSIAVMTYVVHLKLRQHVEELEPLLKNTGGRPIVECSRQDDFWGAKPSDDWEHLTGVNALGKIWMKLRAENAWRTDPPPPTF